MDRADPEISYVDWISVTGTAGFLVLLAGDCMVVRSGIRPICDVIHDHSCSGNDERRPFLFWERGPFLFWDTTTLFWERATFCVLGTRTTLGTSDHSGNGTL